MTDNEGAVHMTWLEFHKIITDELSKKEDTTMQVTYNGFTGELVKLELLQTERKMTTINVISGHTVYQKDIILYDLSIYDSEKQVTHSFTGVKLEDMKFLGGEVSFR